MIEIAEGIQLFQRETARVVGKQRFQGQLAPRPAIHGVVVHKHPVEHARRRVFRRKGPQGQTILGIVHARHLFQPVRGAGLKKPLVHALHAYALHRRTVGHAPAVLRKVDARAAAHHGRVRRNAAAFPVHLVELKDVGHAHIGGAPNASLQKNEPVRPAHAAHDGLHTSARGKNLHVRLHVLRLVAARLRPLVGPVETRPAHGLGTIRQTAHHQKVAQHPEHLARRRALHGQKLPGAARSHGAFHERRAAERVHGRAVFGKLAHVGKRLSVMLLCPLPALKREHSALRGGKGEQIAARILQGKGGKHSLRKRRIQKRRQPGKRPVTAPGRNHVFRFRSLRAVKKRGVRLPRPEIKPHSACCHSTTPCQSAPATVRGLQSARPACA